MKIDFTAIIAAANTRKDNLQALQAALTETPQHLRNLQEALMHIDRVARVYMTLDTEGKALVPVGVSEPLKNLHGYIFQLKRNLEGAGTNPVSVDHFIAALGE